LAISPNLLSSIVITIKKRRWRIMIKMKDILASKGHDIWSIGPNKTVFEALELMAEKEIGALLVMDGERVNGLFSERDYARKMILKGLSSKETNVSDVMTSRVICSSLDHTADECMALMTEKRVRHLPIVENDKVVGLISIGDIVKAVISDQQFTIDVLEKYISS
jgi:CBS domain-containing protein